MNGTVGLSLGPETVCGVFTPSWSMIAAVREYNVHAPTQPRGSSLKVGLRAL